MPALLSLLTVLAAAPASPSGVCAELAASLNRMETEGYEVDRAPVSPECRAAFEAHETGELEARLLRMARRYKPVDHIDRDDPAATAAMALLCELRPTWAVEEMKQGLATPRYGAGTWEEWISAHCLVGLVESGSIEGIDAFDAFVEAHGLVSGADRPAVARSVMSAAAGSEAVRTRLGPLLGRAHAARSFNYDALHRQVCENGSRIAECDLPAEQEAVWREEKHRKDVAQSVKANGLLALAVVVVGVAFRKSSEGRAVAIVASVAGGGGLGLVVGLYGTDPYGPGLERLMAGVIGMLFSAGISFVVSFLMSREHGLRVPFLIVGAAAYVFAAYQLAARSYH